MTREALEARRAWRIERLSPSHQARRFSCGVHQLDHFLRKHALENDRRGLGTTYDAVEFETEKVLGYVTLCTNSIRFQNVPEESLPHYPIPALLVARLAVDRSAQGLGIGTELMLTALRIAEKVADRVGVFAVTVDALSPHAKAFYQQVFGFSELLDDPRHLFLTIADLRASGIREER